MKEQKIEHAIFDYGGVIGFSSKNEVVTRIAQNCDVDPNKISQIILKNTINMQKVSMPEEDFWRGITKGLKVNNLDNLAYTWIETIKGTSKIDLDVLTFLEDLSKFYKLSLLSNSTQLYFYSPFRSVLNRLFSEEIYSCDIGFRKPEKEIYDSTLTRLNAGPSQCVIIDDEPENLVYPSSIGMATVLYKGLPDLKSKLCRQPVLK